MTTSFDNLINDVSKSLTLLSKVRCVENFQLTPDCKRKHLFSWPNSRYLDSEGKTLLEQKGVNIRDFRVNSFSVPYSIYDQMKKVELAEIEDVRLIRVLLDVFRISSERQPVTGVTTVWDTEKNPYVNAPNSMSDEQRLRDFAKRTDSYLVFRRAGEKYDIKLRAAAYTAVLHERPELRDVTVSSGELREFVSQKADREGRQNRHIVFESNKEYVLDVIRQTNRSVEKLIDRDDLMKKIKQSFCTT